MCVVLMIAKMVWALRYENVLSIHFNDYKCTSVDMSLGSKKKRDVKN